MNRKRFRGDFTNSSQATKSPEVVFYNKGSCLDWARAQTKIEDQFKIEGVCDFIKAPSEYVKPEGDMELINIPEKQLDMVEPTYEKDVKEKLVNDERSWLTIYELKQKEIEDSTFTKPEKKKLLFESKLDYHNRLEKRNMNESKYMNDLTTIKIKYDEVLNKFQKEQAKALGIFKKCISSSVLYPIKTDLDNLKLRTAWMKLCCQNSTGNNDEYVEFGLIKNITLLKFDGKDINNHLNQFAVLYGQLTEFGIIFPDKLMKAFLVNSIKDSSYCTEELQTVIDHCVCNKLTYHALVSMLQAATSRGFIDKQILKQNNINTPKPINKNVALNVSSESSMNNSNINTAVQSSQLKCTECGRIGHTVDTCFKIHPCKRCNKLGHTDKKWRTVIHQQTTDKSNVEKKDRKINSTQVRLVDDFNQNNDDST